MQFLLIIFCFFIFFYALYVLGKEDYVLFRKNISLEQLFDLAFAGIFVGLVADWFLSVIFHTGVNFVLAYVIFGFIMPIYLLGKYRRLPIGRLFDFFSLALLSALPLGYLVSIFFVKRNEIIFYLIQGIFYLLLQILFWRILLPWMINAKVKDGTLCSLFLLSFSFVSFFVLHLSQFRNFSLYFKPEDFILMSMSLGSVLFLLRNVLRSQIPLRGKR